MCGDNSPTVSASRGVGFHFPSGGEYFLSDNLYLEKVSATKKYNIYLLLRAAKKKIIYNYDCVMNVRNVAPGAVINSLILFPNDQSLFFFSPSLSLSFTFCYNLKQGSERERESWERRERRGKRR